MSAEPAHPSGNPDAEVCSLFPHESTLAMTKGEMNVLFYSHRQHVRVVRIAPLN